MKTCRKCNTENNTEAKFCESCGNILDTQAKQQPTTSDINFCPDCGKMIETGASFCADCGTAFGEQCTECQTINQANAKFCAGCATPLKWVCSICNNKNQTGAIFCATCGKDTQVSFGKNLLKPQYIVAASLVLLIVLFGISNNFWVSNSNEDNNNSYQNNSSKSNKTKSNTSTSNCKDFAHVKFEASPTCIIKSVFSVSNVDGFSQISTDEFWHNADISGNNCIAGYYEFSWTFYSQCVNVGKPDGPYSYSGTFYLDGKHMEYTVVISDSWGDVTLEVRNY